MRYLLLFLFLISAVSVMSQAEGVQIIYKENNPNSIYDHQITPHNINNSYKIIVSLKNKRQYISKGYLYEISDTAVFVYEPPPSYNYTDYKNNTGNSQYKLPYKIVYIEVSEIKNISYRRKNSIGVGVGIGAVTGFIVGGTFGYLQGDDICKEFCVFTFSAQDKIYLYGIPSMLIGIAAGAFIGSNYTTIKIDGKKTIYDNYKKELAAFSIIK